MDIHSRGGVEGRGGRKKKFQLFGVAGEQFEYLVAGEKLECLGDRGISPQNFTVVFMWYVFLVWCVM